MTWTIWVVPSPGHVSVMNPPSTALLLTVKKLQEGANQSENAGNRKPSPTSWRESILLLQIIPNGRNHEKDRDVGQNCLRSHGPAERCVPGIDQPEIVR